MIRVFPIANDWARNPRCVCATARKFAATLAFPGSRLSCFDAEKDFCLIQAHRYSY